MYEPDGFEFVISALLEIHFATLDVFILFVDFGNNSELTTTGKI